MKNKAMIGGNGILDHAITEYERQTGYAPKYLWVAPDSHYVQYGGSMGLRVMVDKRLQGTDQFYLGRKIKGV